MEHAQAPAIEAGRRYARQLAAESIARSDPTGWFEPLYAAAEQGATTVPWADLAPYPGLVSALAGVPGRGRALVVGCGLATMPNTVDFLDDALVRRWRAWFTLPVWPDLLANP